MTRAEFHSRAEKRRNQIAEQNAGSAAEAEEHLKRAIELEPHNQRAIEYLAGLYFAVRDPATEGHARADDAKRWYGRLLEIDPGHPFANYMFGVIDCEAAISIIRSTVGIPRPLNDDSLRQSLRAQAGPLLAESARNFVRALEIDPNNSNAVIYLMLVKRNQAYIAEMESEAIQDRTEADALEQKVYKTAEARANQSGQPWPPGDMASITFTPVPQPAGGTSPIPSFPPDARPRTVPLAPPPPPPPSGR